MKKIIFICLILAVMFIGSCKQGEFEGKGGGGNLIILGLSEYNNKYIEVNGTVNAVTLKFYDPERVQIKKQRVSAPLFNGTEQYKDSATCNNFVINIFDTSTSDTPAFTKSNIEVRFFSGSAVIDLAALP